MKRQRGVITLYFIGALVVALGVAIVIGKFQSNKIEKLHKQVAAYEVVTDAYVQALEQQQIAINDVIKINEECVSLREQAEIRAIEAERRLQAALNRSFIRSQERVNEINKDNRVAVCSSPVPARTVELLVEAATSANRGQGSN